MKSLLNSIQEKLVITKDTKEKSSKGIVDFSMFCHELCLYDSPMNHKSLEELYDLYKNDCENVIGKEFNGELLSTNFELIFMCATMLNADDLSYSHFPTLGTSRYSGSYNPYDFSWFEVTDKHGISVLDTMHYLYGETNFLTLFNKIYKIIDRTCTSYRHAIDGIWKLHTKV